MYSKVLLKSQDSILQTIEYGFRWTRPQLVPLLATRCIFLGGTDPQAYDMSCWPAVQLLITRCLYLTLGHQGAYRECWGVRGYWGLHMKYKDGLLQSPLENSRRSIGDNRTWAEINWTKVSTILGHQIALPGGRYIWTQVSCMYISTIIFSGQFYLH